MARPLDQNRRRELLLAALIYAAHHGLADLSLRPLARALGTSDRMLLHYFGTKENLIGQALAASRPDVPRLVDSPSADAIRAQAHLLWHDMTTGGDQETRVRLLLEVLVMAMTKADRYGENARRAVTDWVRPLGDALRSLGFERRDAEARSTALVSGLRGLALDFYVTGDGVRVNAAADRLITAMTTGSGPTTDPVHS